MRARLGYDLVWNRRGPWTVDCGVEELVGMDG